MIQKLIYSCTIAITAIFFIVGCGNSKVNSSDINIADSQGYNFEDLQQKQQEESFKDMGYSEYIVRTLTSEIKKLDGILDCNITIDGLLSEIVSVDVKILKKSNAVVSEEHIKAYISESLNIEDNLVNIIFD